MFLLNQNALERIKIRLLRFTIQNVSIKSNEE